VNDKDSEASNESMAVVAPDAGEGVGLTAATTDPRLYNEDLAPTPVEKRTWGTWNYAALWMGMVHSAFGFAVLGTMIATGMSAWQALAVVFVANLIQMILMGFTGRVGARHGVPLAVWARSTFGVWGANVPALLRGFVAIGWFGVQSYLGATAVNALLGAVWGAWRDWHTIVFGVGLNLWICMAFYWGVNVLVVRRGMETIRRFESWAGPMVFVLLIPMLIWALVKGHGVGPVFHVASKYHSTGSFFVHAFVPGIAWFISASWATMVLNLPDLTRFAKSNRAQLKGLFIGLPAATFVFYGMAAIIVSGTQAATGKLLWNPADVLTAIGNTYLTVLGAIIITVATLSVNVAANLVSPAYDLTNLAPKIFTFKRGAYVAILLAFFYGPWKLMQSPTTLFNILDNVGAVLGPATGVLLADYYVLHRRRLDVPALYDPHGRYAGIGGFNPWSIGVLAVGSLVCLMGQVVSAMHWAYQYAALFGIAFGFVAYIAVWPLVKRSSLAGMTEPAGDEGVELEALLARGEVMLGER
jgi:nucleobase:cation symporter-1, NCS1 family